ncbi:MAG: radical SAM protein [Acidimicrobiales bacterium]
MHVLLLSTYELGHQPLGIAGPAAVLGRAGHEVRGRDLSVETVRHDDVEWADAVLCSVPMHTALRLALAVLESVRDARPGLPVALHGLYATVGAPALEPGDLAVAGESDDALREWVAGLGVAAPSVQGAAGGAGPTVRVELGSRHGARPGPDGPGGSGGPGRSRPYAPDRSLLPPLERYARLVGDGPDRLVGAVEATRGCSHRCRHCPVPTVYDGRTRAVSLDEVMADVAQVVASGAGHVHFADPDFLNRPSHASRVVAAIRARFPDVSFDATVKVSHVLAHQDLVAEMGASGCTFVVSAFESTSETVLERLDKGHTVEQAGEAVRVLRDAGIEPRPSFLPFTPWTTRDDLVELLDFVAAFGLVESVDAVQYGIRLLLPPGSLLLRSPDPVLAGALGTFDPDALGFSWRSPDPLLDELQRAISTETERAACDGLAAEPAYLAVRSLVFETLGRDDPGPPEPVTARHAGAHPHLSEAWFCCAEPTSLQLGSVRDGMLAARP